MTPWFQHLFILSKPYWPLAATLSFFMVLVSLVLLPVICLWLPQDHFINPPTTNRKSPTALLIALLRNLLALFLFALGVLMLFLPGQGLLTILVALVVAVFPGKQHLERLIIRRPIIFKSINWIRKRYHRPAIIHPDQHDTGMR